MITNVKVKVFNLDRPIRCKHGANPKILAWITEMWLERSFRNRTKSATSNLCVFEMLAAHALPNKKPMAQEAEKVARYFVNFKKAATYRHW